MFGSQGHLFVQPVTPFLFFNPGQQLTMSMIWRQGDLVRHNGAEYTIYCVSDRVAYLTDGKTESQIHEVQLRHLELISSITESTTVPEVAEVAEASESGEIPEELHVKKSEAPEAVEAPAVTKKKKKTRGR